MYIVFFIFGMNEILLQTVKASHILISAVSSNVARGRNNVACGHNNVACGRGRDLEGNRRSKNLVNELTVIFIPWWTWQIPTDVRSHFVPDYTAWHQRKHYVSNLQFIKRLYLPLLLGVHLMSDVELIRQGDSKKSPYVGILCYLHAPVVRSAVSRSLDWSRWSRGVACEVEGLRISSYLIFTCGGHLKAMVYR
jgi:hypothetical protein